MYLAPVLGIVALLFAFVLASKVGREEEGTDRMHEISSAIRDGANAFLKAEYKILVIFAAVLFVLIGFGVDWKTAICFVIGAAFSTLAGYFGMNVATKANVRTANAARVGGMNRALSIAFSGGAVMGMSVVGLGLLGSVCGIAPCHRHQSCVANSSLYSPPAYPRTTYGTWRWNPRESRYQDENWIVWWQDRTIRVDGVSELFP